LAELTRALEQDPEAPISALDILPEAERRQIVVEDNETGTEFSRYACLHEMFEAQAAKTPDAIALTFADDRLTYRELNARANRLAHRLVELGVGPETVVGVCGERSLELVVGLIGVLKASGAYLPLDPENPDERLAYLIDDARPMLILAHERFRTRLPKAVAIFSLEEIGASKDAWSDRDPGRRATAENLAYVIYTSGSTGRPKGVAVAHRGVVNRLQWMQARYSLTEVDCVLQKTPFGFDVSVWEFFWPLTVGARLTLASPDDHRDPRRLNEVIERERVTTLHFVPSMLQTFLNATEARALDGVRRVLCSGEELSAVLAGQFLDQQTPQLHNLYGPTEASIDVTAHECASASNDARVPIGRPIWNTQIYLLDDCLRPTPSGAAGELYIGGVGLARGYLGRPDLTAERFIPNPFGAPGERLYRTGDLARRRPDGDIEYLGRLDDQVKIRGLRIELAEVEAALSKLDAIGQVAVVAREDAAGDKRLVAYVVGRDGVKPSWADVRAALLHELPEYMIPSTFVAIDALPLTANGKVDRKALPAPDAEAASRRRHIGPRTATEEALCRIWAEVLGLETVGVEDNFFELGGHSLKAIQVISRIWRDLGVSLPMSAFYGADALSAVAESVDIIRGLECLNSLRNASSSSKIEEFEI
ncbi:MAG: non-ribosomal peptide synthetase, partial [Methylocystaceae bacterium]